MMKSKLLPLLFVAVALTGSRAASLVDDAKRAADEGIYPVATQKLQDFLRSRPPAAEEKAARELLGRALFKSGRAEDALHELAGIDGDTAGLLRGECLLALNRLTVAREEFAKVKTPQGRIGEAEALRAMGRGGEAVKVLGQSEGGPAVRLRLAELLLERRDATAVEKLLKSVQPGTDAERTAKQCLDARLLLLKGNAAGALTALEDLLHGGATLSDSIQAAATLALAEAREELSGGESADDLLELFISKNPQSRHLSAMFEALDRIYATEESASEDALSKWAAGKEVERAGLALFYLARVEWRAQKNSRAIERLAQLEKNFPAHPLQARAYLLRGRILGDEKKPGEALAAYEKAMRASSDPDTIAEAEIAAGCLHFQMGEALVATNLFHSAAERSWVHREQALYDSALAWLQLENTERFIEDYKALSALAPESQTRVSLLFEEGMVQAASGDPKAAETLSLFTRDFSNHPKVAAAKIALAELAFLATPPRKDEASKYLRAANEMPKDTETAERAEYLAIFLADSQQGESPAKAAEEACRAFIRKHPQSALLQEVRMKLGQIYFREEDYPDARTQFETIAQESAPSPLVEGAVFLAAESAMRMMSKESVGRAIELFDQVAKFDGPLKLQARFQQAVAQSRLGNDQDAIVLYDEVLAGAPDTDLRAAALTGKGDTLLAVSGTNTAQIDKAAAVFDQVAAFPGVTPDWRNQAMYKKGKCLEKLGRVNETLATYYDILDAPQGGGRVPEYFWFYKAGFDAAHILEGQQQWQAAVGIYKKIAAVEGPQAADAKARASQIQLEHFLWEE
jgi:tetratricopeptide (TPR) repeat protein